MKVSKFAFLLPGLVVVVCWGCGDDSGLEKRYPVSGKVTYKDQPVEKGKINFVPEKAGDRGAGGDIVAGNYSLTTATPNDGALPGNYKVTISSVAIDTTELNKVAGGGQHHLGPESAKIMKKALSNALPSKYTLTDTSGLSAKVEEHSNTFNFDLKD